MKTHYLLYLVLITFSAQAANLSDYIDIFVTDFMPHSRNKRNLKLRPANSLGCGIKLIASMI